MSGACALRLAPLMPFGMSNLAAFLLYSTLAAFLGCAILSLSWLLGPKRYADDKLDPYECGVELLGRTRERIPMAFYLTAILFVIFDVEVLYLIPWAVAFQELGMAGLVEIGIFIGLLGIGLFYVWKRGALQWDS